MPLKVNFLFRHKALGSILAAFLFLLLSIKVGTEVLYTHSYIGSDGISYTHAHPYAKQTGDGTIPIHSHSKAELNLFTIFGFILSGLGIALAFSPMLFINEKKVDEENPIFAISQNILKGRAPPSNIRYLENH